MLEKPDIKDRDMIDRLQTGYRLDIEQIEFLPLGADRNTAVYRVTTRAQTPYFLKLRRGDIDRAGVTVPKYLSDHGLQQVIPPLETLTGQLWIGLGDFTAILYPFVEGQNGFQRSLTDRQWLEFGTTLRRFHDTDFPPAVTADVPREAFSPRWREMVRGFLGEVKVKTFQEPVAAETAAFLGAKSAETLELVERTERLARVLRERPREFVLCHADIHGWNLLLEATGAFYMVDWDTLIFAPRERDLMFIGAGLEGRGRTPGEEETLFYQGYGRVDVDPDALSYYRCERIIEDIAVYCEQIFLSDEGGADREEALVYLKSNFLPNGAIAMARRSAGSGKIP